MNGLEQSISNDALTEFQLAASSFAVNLNTSTVC